VVFDGAYHGRTNMTLAMTSKFSLFKKGYGPFAPEVYRSRSRTRIGGRRS
jgi:4-aminobutyrate aminotransferase/(S)-3-amino-2-methylpropionate transaminase